MDAKRQAEIFEAMPHVDEIWVTEDGHFHLHPNNGGELICRGDAEVANEETETPKVLKPVVKRRPQIKK